MKRIFTIALFFSLVINLVIPVGAYAVAYEPSGMDDTIPATRYENYYYTKWFDECPNYYPDGVVDSCHCRFYQFHNFYGTASVAKWEHTNQRIRVKGLVAMVSTYTPYAYFINPDTLKRPEYLYLYQVTGRHYALLHSLGIEDGLDLTLVDSVRWDTATARFMELRRGWNGEYNQYCYLYEAYFENPVYVDSDFYIFGSTNSNVPASVGSAYWRYIPTIYVDIMDFGAGATDTSKECANAPALPYDEWCKPQGGWVAINETSLGWHMNWPDSPWGYYLAIVDQWNLDAVPEDTTFGVVIGGGRWPDDTYDTIEALPEPGYLFYMWNDSCTDNPRVIHLTSDTVFTAHFISTERYTLSLTPVNADMGTVTGSGLYPEGIDIIISAEPYHDYKFSHWNDGVTDNPRTVRLSSDTSFAAFFVAKELFTVHTSTNNDEWGTVNGGGIVMEGEEATLTVTTEPFCYFEGWSDGDWSLPRIVTVTQDTLFTAIFSFDSVRAAGIDMAGDLDFVVSPNPTTGKLAINVSRQPFEYAIFDMSGKSLLKAKCNDPTAIADVSMLPSGRYLLIVRSKDKYGIKTIVKK